MKDILSELNNKDYIKNLSIDYDIHFCSRNEVDELVEFIDKYWRHNHIFVLSRELLDWQHYDRENKRYNFVLAKHKKSGELHSILGFVPTYQFDSAIKSVEIWPCIWKSRDDVHVKGLGVALYYYLKSNVTVETISILGISEIALSIYKHWNFKTGKIEQYYFSNEDEPEIISLNRRSISIPSSTSEGWKIEKLSINEYQEIDATDKIFLTISKYKSKQYYINRYYKHPIYKYDFWAIMHEGCIDSIIIARECGTTEAKCLRIVDYIGDIASLSNVRCDLQTLMKEEHYEYIDFILVGVESKILENAGFINRKKNPQTIIPNYFEPFVKENVDLDYAFKTVNPEVGALFYKADADQDRPNTLNK